MIGTTLIGTTLLGSKGSIVSAPLFVSDSVFERGVGFRLKVLNADYEFLAEIVHLTAGTHTQRMNEPDLLEISVPYDAYEAGFLTRPNQIAVYAGSADSGFNTLVGNFKIVRQKETRDSRGGKTVHISARSLLADLADATIPYYEVRTEDEKSLYTVLQEILAFQVDTNYFIGMLDSELGDIVLPLRIENKSILYALREIQRQVGGYFWLHPSSTLPHLAWAAFPGNSGRRIEYRHNLTNIERDVDHDQCVTRLYARGKSLNQGGYITLQDAGEPEDYIEADTVPTWGRRSHTEIFGQIHDPAVLLEVATAYLEAHKNPATTYRVGTVDAMPVGQMVTVYDPDLAQDGVEHRVVELKRNLTPDKILDVTVTLAQPRRDFKTFLTKQLLLQRTAAAGEGNPLENVGRTYHAESLEELNNFVDPEKPDHRPGLEFTPNDRAIVSAEAGAVPVFYSRDPENENWFLEQGGVSEADFEELLEEHDVITGDNFDDEFLQNKGTDIQRVGDANDAGSGLPYAASDHVHEHHEYMAKMFKGATEPSGLGETEGDLWWDQANKVHKYFEGGVWKEFSQALLHVAETLVALNQIEADDGHLGYVTSDGENTGAYRRVGGAWIVDAVIHPALGTKPPGSIAYSSGKGMQNVDGGWKSTTHVL